MKVFCKEFITVWTRGLVRWLSQKFDSISIDLTPVEEKLDEVKSNVADVKTAVENIDMSATEERIMGGKLPLNSGESVPAFIGDGDLSDVNDMNEDGELYTYSAMQLPETVAVGDVFTAGSFQEHTEGMFFLSKAANDPSLYYDGQDFSVSGITEKLEVQAGKSYIVTGVYELHYEDEGYGVEASGLLLTYDEYEQGRSVREVYKKLDELDVHDENAKHLASFFNITEATEYTALTPAEAIAIARDCQYNVMGTDWPIPTWLPTGVTEAQVESAAEGLGIPYHEPTQTA